MSGRLSISLPALAANFHTLRRHARGAVAAVVKADGYGLGAVAVAARLRKEGCEEFFVATCSEGVTLRHAHPDLTIYVLEGAYTETLSALIDDNLTPVLNTPEQVRLWSSTGRNAAAHIDSGMQRLGLPAAQATRCLLDSGIELTLLLSHFARADEVGHATLRAQSEITQSVFTGLRQQFPRLRLSLCNSAAMMQGLGPEDLGRAGIALYGGNPFTGRDNPMQPVVSMHARVMQVREIEAGVAVGYGGTYVSAAPMRLAVLGVGYADGLPRLLSNRGAVWLAGQRRPMAGRVSMDLTIVDVSGVDVAEGDEAEVFGDMISVDEVAEQADTIAYEILTGISRRMARRYD